MVFRKSYSILCVPLVFFSLLLSPFFLFLSIVTISFRSLKNLLAIWLRVELPENFSRCEPHKSCVAMAMFCQNSIPFFSLSSLRTTPKPNFIYFYCWMFYISISSRIKSKYYKTRAFSYFHKMYCVVCNNNVILCVHACEDFFNLICVSCFGIFESDEKVSSRYSLRCDFDGILGRKRVVLVSQALSY